MPIKKSVLEKNIFYRIAKVFFLLLPWVPAVPVIVYETQQSNIYNIVYVAIGLVVYYLILNLVWRGFLYIFFGGLEDDTVKAVSRGVQSAVSATQSGGMSPEDKKQVGFYLFILVMIILVYFIVTYKGSVPSPFPWPTPGPKCVSTGCGNNWYSSCTKKCYQTNTDCRTASSACGSFTCRQCP